MSISNDSVITASNNSPHSRNITTSEDTPNIFNGNISDQIYDSGGNINHAIIEHSEEDKGSGNISQFTNENISNKNNNEILKTDVLAFEDDLWLDILGSSCLKKLLIIKGNGRRASKGQLVKLSYEVRLESIDGEIVEVEQGLDVIVDDCDLLKGIDLALSIMEENEESWLYFTSRFGYEDIGNGYNIPPRANLYCLVKIEEVKMFPIFFNIAEDILEIAEKKKNRGNKLFKLKLHDQASIVYLSAIRVLETQELVLPNAQELKCRCLTNLAITQYHLNNKEDSLTSCDRALQLFPKDQKALFRKAKIYIDKQEYSVALNLLGIARESSTFSPCIETEFLRIKQLLAQSERRNREMYRRMFTSVSTKGMGNNNCKNEEKYSNRHDNMIITIIGAGLIALIGICVGAYIYKGK